MFIAENNLMKKHQTQPQTTKSEFEKKCFSPCSSAYVEPRDVSAHVKNTCMTGFLSR